MIKFYLCNKCCKQDYKQIVSYLRNTYPNCRFDIKCQSYCGPGSNQLFIGVNEKYVVANNVDELYEKIDKILIEDKLC